MQKRTRRHHRRSHRHRNHRLGSNNRHSNRPSTMRGNREEVAEDNSTAFAFRMVEPNSNRHHQNSQMPALPVPAGGKASGKQVKYEGSMQDKRRE